MRETGTVGQTPSTRVIRRRVPNIALWALQTLLAIMVAMAGLAKVFGDPAMVEMFATIGVGQWFRYLVGALEIAGAVRVLVPASAGGRPRTGLPDGGRDPDQHFRPWREARYSRSSCVLASVLVAPVGRWPWTRTLFTNREAGRPQ